MGFGQNGTDKRLSTDLQTYLNSNLIQPLTDAVYYSKGTDKGTNHHK